MLHSFLGGTERAIPFAIRKNLLKSCWTDGSKVNHGIDNENGNGQLHSMATGILSAIIYTLIIMWNGQFLCIYLGECCSLIGRPGWLFLFKDCSEIIDVHINKNNIKVHLSWPSEKLPLSSYLILNFPAPHKLLLHRCSFDVIISVVGPMN